MSDDEDFRLQLELEAKEAAAKAAQNSSAASTSTSSSANPYLYTDPTGTVYEWDHSRRAWIPKIDDDFLARYQAAYGFTETTEQQESKSKETEADNKQSADHPVQAAGDKQPVTQSDDKESEAPESEKPQPVQTGKRKKKGEPEKPAEWFDVDDDHNTNVYISNLPLDTTEEELLELMSKYGLVMKDLQTNKHKIKMYRDANGNFKGDALCTYIKVESVELALQLLDESNFKNKVIKCERAKFTLKGEYDASKKPKRKIDRRKVKKKMDKLFDWRPEKITGERGKWEKVVIIKNMFDISEFAKDPRLILEYRSDVRDECQEKCGEVKKVEIYDTNPDGVAAVFFNDVTAADKCVQLMHGRFFAGRKLQAFNWDGKEKYKINESEQEAEKRMQEWDKFLQEDD
jgi:HIV Tat-specific factor 1